MRGAEEEYEDEELDEAAAIPRNAARTQENDADASDNEDGEDVFDLVERRRNRRRKKQNRVMQFILNEVEVSGDESADENEGGEEEGEDNLGGFIVNDNEVEEGRNSPPPNPYMSDSDDGNEGVVENDDIALGDD